MKLKSIFIILVLFLCTYLFADIVELFFSEYIEGSSNNKALEIYNGSGSEISLEYYRINQSVNGGGWEYQHYFPAGATITDGDVWVITTDTAVAALQDVADEILAYPSVVHFNGNDARGLEKTIDGGITWTLLDAIGDPDEDPGDGWAVAGVNNATKDHTLVRKSTVEAPTTDWALSAGTNASDSQWEVYDLNTFDYIGFHDAGADIIPPTLISAVALSSTSVEITFSEPLDETTAENTGNYSIDPFLDISSASLATNKVTLTTSEQTEAENYTITVNNVEDLSENVIEPNSTIGFTGYEEGPTEGQLIFSEYIEGSSNNKAIEVYNTSSLTVYLDNYRIVSSYNGSGWNAEYYAFPDGATLAVGDVWVIANEDATPTILTQADDILAYNAGGYVVSFNGNDARGIEMTTDGGATWTLIDVIGNPNEDPGTGWEVAGTAGATKDHTLVRKTAIENGNTDWISSAGTNESDSEWIVYPIDTFDYIGSHGGGVGGNVVISNLNPDTGEPVTITFSYPSDFESVLLYWKTASDVNFEPIEMDTISVRADYQATIPGQKQGTTVYFYIVVTDTSGVTIYFPENYPDEPPYDYQYSVTSHQAILNIPAKPFNPYAGETFPIEFASHGGDKAILRIYNAEGKLAFTPQNIIISNSSGITRYEWDGRDKYQNLLPIGLYICYLEVINADTGSKKTAKAPIIIGAPLK